MGRITVTLPQEQIDAAKRAVSEGRATSVSAYVAACLEAAQPGPPLQELLDRWDTELGPPSAEDVAWARAQLGQRA